jgi:hypothetical protein
MALMFEEDAGVRLQEISCIGSPPLLLQKLA